MNRMDFKQCLARRLAIIMFALMLPAIVIVPGCGKTNLTDAQYVQRAKDYRDKGELRASVIELKNALAKNPNNVEARWLLGKIYVELGDGAGAEKELRRAAELGIDPAAIMLPLGKALLLSGQYDRLLKEIRPFPALSVGDKAEVHALLGAAHLGKRELDQAAKELQLALELNRDSLGAQMLRVRLSTAHGRIEEALDWIRKLLAAHPKAGKAWSLLGDLERRRGQGRAAESAYTKAIENRANNISDRYMRALVRIGLKEYKGAARDVAIMKKVAPQRPEVSYAGGLLDFQQRRYADAQGAFEKALQHAPNFMPAVFYLGVAHYLQGHFQQADQYLSRFLRAFPESREAGLMLGMVRLRVGNIDGAESVLKPVLARHPDDVLTLNLMANIAVARHDTEAGIGYLKKAIALRPQSAVTRLKLGLSMLMGGAASQGIKELETAVELDPQFQPGYPTLIVAQLQAREFDGAIKTAARMREMQPDNPLALNLIGLAKLGKGDETGAEQAFQSAMKMAPGDPTAALNLAALALKKKHVDQARSLYQQVLEHHPRHVQTLIRLALVEGAAGRRGKAKALLERAVQANPKMLEPRLMLASDELRNGRPSGALALLQGVEDSYRDNPALLAIVGQARLAANRPDDALATLQRLARIRPRAAEPHYFLAKAYGELGRADKVREELRKALKLNPGHLPSRIAMVRLLISEAKLDAAGKALEDLRRLGPEQPEVLFLEGQLAMQRGRPRVAAAAFEKVMARAPSGIVVSALARAYWRAGKRERSVAALEQWLKGHPADTAVRYRLGGYFMAQNRPGRATATLVAVLEQKPDHVPALNDLAWLLRKENPTKALDYAERAARLAPNTPEVLDTLGVILLDQGQRRRALRTLQDAAQKAIGNPTIRYHLATAMAGNDDKEGAKRVLRKLLGAKGGFAERREAESLLRELGG